MFEALKRMLRPSFWSWFAANGERLRRAFEVEPEATATAIGRRFQAAHPDLVWEIARMPEGPAFCVSADGDRERFPAVLDVVRSAPVVPGWSVMAFRQPGAAEGRVRFGDTSLGADDVWCATRPADGGVQILLWIRGLTDETAEPLARAAHILLDNTIGEWEAAMKVVDVHPAPLPENPGVLANAVPLRELPRVLGSYPPREVAAIH